MNTYHKGRFDLPDIIPLVRLPVLAAVTRVELAAETQEELTGPPVKRRRLSFTAGGVGSGVVVEQTPVGMGGPVSKPRSEPPVAAALAADPLSPECAPQQEGNTLLSEDHERDSSDSEGAGESGEVVASGEPVERSGASVGERLSSPSSDEDDDEDSGPGASFRRSTRIRRPNARLFDYVVELPESLVIQAMHAVMNPTSVNEALEAPDADQWIEALYKEFRELLRNNT
ncbi:hypothetical protein PR003_g23405 [Phytophthora rubi]|uniref:Uncharacterized protein n=1 Tax=Phytophthora rubi TaxID=129364 RepID=A0A6A4CX61_9STRA|nr:hypothetical protein PR003_g23405 [Phytophthora rubi]